MRYTPVALLTLLLATPLASQEWQVARERFAFAGTRLSIHVDARSPGSLQVIRGAPGSVRVASRATAGLTAAGLASDEELTLTAAGTGPVQYVVSVPEEVWIQVRLPGRLRGEAMARHDRSRTFEWNESDAVATHAPQWLPSAAEAGALYTTYAQDRAPGIVSVPDLSTIRSLSVRIEGGRFRVNTGRPLSVERGGDDRLEIRTSDPPMDVVVVVPAATRGFRLEAGGKTALLVNGDQVTALCSPVTQQWLSDGRHWLTFNPVEGSLRCSSPIPARHEG